MIDNVALLPLYVAAGTAVAALLADLIAPGRRGVVVAATAVGVLATLVVGAVSRGGRSFCVEAGCSYVYDGRAAVVAVVFAALTLGVLALSAPVLRDGDVPAGEYCFLLACSMTGGVVLGASRDLISLIVALETLTLPLYVLVGLRRRSSSSAEAAVTFLVISVVSTAVSLLGAALVYAATGAVHLGAIGDPLDGQLRPLATVGVVLLLTGLAFKVAAVPLHAWAPVTYDGAPLPVAAYLSTASKLGGVVAIVVVVVEALDEYRAVAGPALAVLAVATMTVGNLVALRQRRMVRLLAWSSVAQAGYILAPLVVVGGAGAALAYTIFFVILELAAFGAVIGLRGAADGGEIADYRGVARRSPLLAGVLAVALAGLAGLPPGLAGLFAKVAVVRALLAGDGGWLAVVVAVNAVIGLAYYVRVAAQLYAPGGSEPVRARLAWPVAAALAVAVAAVLVAGFLPQVVMDAAAR